MYHLKKKSDNDTTGRWRWKFYFLIYMNKNKLSLNCRFEFKGEIMDNLLILPPISTNHIEKARVLLKQQNVSFFLFLKKYTGDIKSADDSIEFHFMTNRNKNKKKLQKILFQFSCFNIEFFHFLFFFFVNITCRRI